MRYKTAIVTISMGILISAVSSRWGACATALRVEVSLDENQRPLRVCTFAKLPFQKWIQHGPTITYDWQSNKLRRDTYRNGFCWRTEMDWSCYASAEEQMAAEERRAAAWRSEAALHRPRRNKEQTDYSGR